MRTASHNKTKLTLRKAQQMARRYADDFTIRRAGITRDRSIVTGDDCIRYREEIGDLLMVYDGNWRFVKTPRTRGWVKGHTTVKRYTTSTGR